MFGVIALFCILSIKFGRWLLRFSKRQQKAIAKNILSFKTIKAIWEAIRECLFHRNIFKTNFLLGYMHFCFAFGWLMLIIMGKVEETFYSGTIWTNPWGGIFFKYFENTAHSYPFKYTMVFIMDLLLLFVLSGTILAIIKRTKSIIMGLQKTPSHSWNDRIALVSLWFIFPLRLFAESVTAGLKQNGGFLTQTVGNSLSFLPLEQIEIPLWWTYSISLGIFFTFMCFTRYMHIFTEILLIFFRKWGVTEEDVRTGYTPIEINACSRCGICLDPCQMNSVANIKYKQPLYLIRDVRNWRLQSFTTDNCLLCNRCEDKCPVGINSSQIRLIYRRKKGFENRDYYDFIVKNNNEIENRNVNVLYFAGCMSHLTPGITEAMKKIFQKANENYHFLDEEASICCGKPLKQQGFLKQAYTLVEKNKDLIRSYNAHILVTSCPICYNSFMKDYQLDIKVMHHTQYIEMLINEGRLKVEKQKFSMIYHDPCEISRGHDIYDAPRNVLKAVGNLLTSEHEKTNTLCCGGSLGNTRLSVKELEDIRDDALAKITTGNPDLLVTACPLCKKSFLRGKQQNIVVKDIAEVIWEKNN